MSDGLFQKHCVSGLGWGVISCWLSRKSGLCLILDVRFHFMVHFPGVWSAWFLVWSLHCISDGVVIRAWVVREGNGPFVT